MSGTAPPLLHTLSCHAQRQHYLLQSNICIMYCLHMNIKQTEIEEDFQLSKTRSIQ